MDGPFNGLHIVGCTIKDTMADGINLHGGATNCTIESNHIRNTGDDAVALWSQKVIAADAGTVITDNRIQLPILANGIAVYGGSDQTLTDNYVADAIQQGGGIHFGNRFASVPLSGTHVASGNTLIRASGIDENWKFGIGAIWFYALEGNQDAVVEVTNTLIKDCPTEAIQFIGKDVTNVKFKNVSIDTVGTFALQLQTGGGASFQDVVATNVGYFGQYDCGVNFKITDLGGNSGWNTTHCGFPPAHLPAP
jgi:hypothetical protein